MLQRIQERQGGLKIHYLKTADELIADVQDIADELKLKILQMNLLIITSKTCNIIESKKLNFSSNNKDYNQPFLMAELESAISMSHDSSPGSDDVLSADSLHSLLAVFIQLEHSPTLGITLCIGGAEVHLQIPLYFQSVEISGDAHNAPI